MTTATFWKVGEKVVNRFDPETVGEIIAVEVSDEPYYPTAFHDEKVKPRVPLEWVKVRFPDRVREYAAHELFRAEEA